MAQFRKKQFRQGTTYKYKNRKHKIRIFIQNLLSKIIIEKV